MASWKQSDLTKSESQNASDPSGVSRLDLSYLPPIYVLPTHIEDERRHDLEDRLLEAGAPLTYDISESRIVVGNVGTKRRAELELRVRKLWTTTIKPSNTERPSKRARLETNDLVKYDQETLVAELAALDPAEVSLVRLEWLEQLLADQEPSMQPFLVYQGYVVEAPPAVEDPSSALEDRRIADSPQPKSNNAVPAPSPVDSGIVQRAMTEAEARPSKLQSRGYAPVYAYGPRKLGQYSHAQHHLAKKARLIPQTTSDYEGSSNDDLPDPPDWVKKGVRYACERITPADSPNAEFIEQLKKIRLARILTDDEIGVRAYSTSIAAVAAYPYHITQAKEILRLPGCDTKIANLWIEWKNKNGCIDIVEEAEDDEAMKVLRDFYGIWGVGATTAREFYFDRGWRDRDDIVEYGWQTLTRVQQIGVKYYEEFLEGIPRAEVEQIAATVKDHAIRVRDTGIELLVVGGYRRGKEYSGDVDLIVSHRDFEKTANLITDIVASLETEDWITHTLLLSLNGTQRGQATLPFKGPGHGGHGFDTLDKALVVWQNPSKAKGTRKNLNTHRRVDIIISPWKTVGCAITGWSGGTTFQRDLRRYAKNKRGWKFDSSGARNRSTGQTIDLEGPQGVAGTMLDAEKAVFQGMGLIYREPWERCTH